MGSGALVANGELGMGGQGAVYAVCALCGLRCELEPGLCTGGPPGPLSPGGPLSFLSLSWVGGGGREGGGGGGVGRG